MVDVRKRVDDWDGCVRRKNFQSLLRKNARDDSLHPSRKTAPHVGNRFALAEVRLGMVEENGATAQAGDAHFKRDTRTQRWLFKNHREETSRKGGLVPFGMRLHVRGQPKELLDLSGGPLGAG